MGSGSSCLKHEIVDISAFQRNGNFVLLFIKKTSKKSSFNLIFLKRHLSQISTKLTKRKKILIMTKPAIPTS